ncbi:hypothetical protein PG999_008464 [Apiospora kogelbergensis]|uniref:Rhodopsin domain-containing protein n=1 Tax=Apiospora kogelbergensis TaxID=1337665 RepID=A0AAW0QUE8_9PEZI
MMCQTNTADYQEKFLQFLIWFIFTAATLSAVVGLGMKYIIMRKLVQEDWLIILAQNVYLAECISTALGVSAGLGKPWDSLSEESRDNYLKYASTVLLVLSLVIIKWSVLVFIQRLSGGTLSRRIHQSLSGFVGVWFVSSTIISLFQCEIPRPWDHVNGRRCIDRRAWWSYVSVINMLSELFIAALYLLVLLKLQISRKRKAIVLSLFLSRLLVVAAAIAQLVIFFRAFPSPDVTRRYKIPVILNETTLSVSVITACVPYLKPFMESLEAGVVRVPSLARSEEELSLGRLTTESCHTPGPSNSTACVSAHSS